METSDGRRSGLWHMHGVKKLTAGQRHLPDGDVVVDGLGAQHGEVDVDAVAGRHADAPHAVLEVGVLLRVARGVNGSVQGGDVAAAQGCQAASEKLAASTRRDFHCPRGGSRSFFLMALGQHAHILVMRVIISLGGTASGYFRVV